MLGASKRGTHSHSIVPSGATSAPVWQSDRNAYSAIGGNGDPGSAAGGEGASLTGATLYAAQPRRWPRVGNGVEARWRQIPAVVVALAATLIATATPASASDGTRLGVCQTIPDAGQRIAAARSLGVDWVRPATVLAGSAGPNRAVLAVRDAGLHTVVTLVNRTASGQPSPPPADVAAYRAQVAT